MTDISFGPATIKVARPTVDAWHALETVMVFHNYTIRPENTFGFNARNIADSTTRSLHAFGIAIDVNANTNPVRKTPEGRHVWFSSKASQAERAHDVLINAADTDMTPAMIDDVRAIKTVEQKPVFGWGGDWNTKKDSMHFHIDVSPQELARGLDPTTIRGFEPEPEEEFIDDNGGAAAAEFAAADDQMNDVFEGTESMVDMSQVERFRPFLDFIAAHEGTARQPGGGYNTSLGYGAYTGGEKNLVGMTLDQINNLQAMMLKHPANRYNSSALGRYQIVGRTLRDLRSKLGLRGNELYSASLQDRLGVALINRHGRNVQGLRNEWASLHRAGESEILAAFDRDGRSGGTVQPQGEVIPFSEPAVSQLMLKPGDRGPEVAALQEALSRRNYQVGKIDGIYGSFTVGAVSSFQHDYNVPTASFGSVDTATWEMLRNATSRPLGEDRQNATAGDLRQMGSQTVLEADRAKLVAAVTAVLGALGLGGNALNGFEPWSENQCTEKCPDKRIDTAPAPVSATIPVDQQIAHAIYPFTSTEIRTFFGLAPAQTTTAGVKINDLERLYTRSSTTLANATPAKTTQTTQSTQSNPLIDLLPAIATQFLPGTGSSALMLALGVASHFFGTRVINRRVQDERNGSNIGAHKRKGRG